jgi:hypothetical protein
MKKRRLHTVLLGAHSQYRAVMTGVAQYLRDTHGCVLHLYCASKEEREFYLREHAILFDSVTVNKVLYSACREPVSDVGATLAEAQRNEKWLGVTYNLLAVSDRHLGRGYALAGFRHPRSHISRETTYLNLVNGYNKAIEFWKNEISDKKADVVINCGKVAATVARTLGVPYRVLAASRYRNLHYWAVNEFFENPAVEEAYRLGGDSAYHQIDLPYETHLQMRAKLSRDTAFVGTMKSMALTAARQFYYKMRGYDKGRSYFVRDNLRYLWECYAARIKLDRSGLLKLDELKGQPFLYYPLHTEPETALQTLSPEYFYQLSSIAALSRDLPAGVMLAVKETIAALGRRPYDFYDQIKEFKNVVMLDMSEHGIECARRADATATITGTGGFEAAVMGRPVISFGRHNRYNFLPHVMLVENETQIAGYLRRVFDGRIDVMESRKNGRRFLQAVAATSFDLADYKVTDPGLIKGEPAREAGEALVAGLGVSDAAQAIAPADV